MNAPDVVTFLENHEFFSGLDREYLELLAEHAEKLELAEDDVLFRFHGEADRFFILIRGRIALEVASLEGPPLILQEVGEGAVLGWSWLIKPYKWSFQARALEPTELFVFDGVMLRERCEQDTEFGFLMLRKFSGLMSERLEFARQKMIDEWRPEGFA